MQTRTISDHTPADRPHAHDIYARITALIVTALEAGVRPWVRPWHATHAAGRMSRPLRHSGQAYSGINVLSLWASAQVQGFAAPIWMTYRQAIALGAHVRAGETGSPVVYTNTITRHEADADRDSEVARDIRFLKGYTVFNVEQIDGLPAQYTALVSPGLDESTRITHAERFFAATGATRTHCGDRAFYRPSTDSIVLPPFAAFRDAERFYATLAHETIHWSGHASRLARDFGPTRFGSAAYAFEELVAELGAAFLCADLGLALDPRDDHSAYVASWLAVLKADTRAIFSAASHAQRAADFLHGLQVTA